MDPVIAALKARAEAAPPLSLEDVLTQKLVAQDQSVIVGIGPHRYLVVYGREYQPDGRLWRHVSVSDAETKTRRPPDTAVVTIAHELGFDDPLDWLQFTDDYPKRGLTVHVLEPVDRGTVMYREIPQGTSGRACC